MTTNQTEPGGSGAGSTVDLKEIKAVADRVSEIESERLPDDFGALIEAAGLSARLRNAVPQLIAALEAARGEIVGFKRDAEEWHGWYESNKALNAQLRQAQARIEVLERVASGYGQVLKDIAADYYHDRHAIWARAALDIAKSHGEARSDDSGESDVDSEAQNPEVAQDAAAAMLTESELRARLAEFERQVQTWGAWAEHYQPVIAAARVMLGIDDTTTPERTGQR